MPKKILLVALFGLALFQLFFINREFAFADNGDYSRYFTFIKKPCGFSVNMPAPGTEEKKARQRTQPLIYWEYDEDLSLKKYAWFSSASFFWDFGDMINRSFFSPKIFSIRNAGLLFYLIHSIFLIVLFAVISKSKEMNILSIIPVILLSIDSCYSVFYNSFYAESVMIMVLQCLFIGIIWLIFFSKDYYLTADVYAGLPLLTVMVVFVCLSKRQYSLYGILFVVPILLYSGATVLKRKKHKYLRLFILLILLSGIVYSVFYAFSPANSRKQKYAIDITNRHAIYYGLLMFSDKKEQIIKELDLPEESIEAVGRHNWNYPESINGTMRNLQIPISSVIKAFSLDPIAFFKLYLNNLSQLCTARINYLGTIPYESYGQIPETIALYSSLLSKISAQWGTRPSLDGGTSRMVHRAGGKLFICAFFISLILFLFSFGLDSHHHNILRYTLAFLIVLTLFDVGLSSFDGVQENTKHIIAASFCISAVYALFFATIGYFISKKVLSRFHFKVLSESQTAESAVAQDSAQSETIDGCVFSGIPASSHKRFLFEITFNCPIKAMKGKEKKFELCFSKKNT